MHLHIARVRRGSTTYVYGQLVESVRRADGMPTQRVVANLGQLDELQIHNLRVSLQASRNGKRVFLDRRALPKVAQFAKPTQNLRYLDVAVLLEIWRQIGFDTVLREVGPEGDPEVAFEDVVAALTINRGADPGSKLFAERWFPRTALPELLRIDPQSFNNTRIHRVLDGLDACTPALMQRLPRLFREREGTFSALFLDITDTRFVGHGPKLAEKAKTKEGVVERKIGIVLLCNQQGDPLRWEVIAGKRPEAMAMHGILDDIRGLDWLGQAPVVFDRAMGCTAELVRLLRTGMRFVTALRVNEFRAYTNAIPHQALAGLEPATQDTDQARDPCVVESASRVEKAGMERISSTLYVLDLGVVQRDAVASEDLPPQGHDEAARAMNLARQMNMMVEQGSVDSLNSAARQLGVGIAVAKKYRHLLRLETGVQQRVLTGDAAGLSLAALAKIARLADSEEQQREFDRLRISGVAKRRRRTRVRTTNAKASGAGEAAPEKAANIEVRVRAVVSFNPELFVDHRRNARRQLLEVQAYLHDLNEKLARPRARRKQRDIEAEIDRTLRQRSLLDVFQVRVEQVHNATGSHFRAHAELDVQKWQRRRCYDGFSLIVAQPEVPHSAAELCQLYRAKDAVEKDFRIIKSLVQLRPVYHQTDAKVRAHVTLCMLALALERALNRRLKNASAEQALDSLRSCCLNRFEDGEGQSHYVVTQADAEQQALLRELKLHDLIDDAYVVERLRPRY